MYITIYKMSTPEKDGRTAPPSSAQKPGQCPKTNLSNFGEAFAYNMLKNLRIEPKKSNIKSDQVRQRLNLDSRKTKSAKKRKRIIESRRKSGFNQPKIW